jgi:hypothetical protein
VEDENLNLKEEKRTEENPEKINQEEDKYNYIPSLEIVKFFVIKKASLLVRRRFKLHSKQAITKLPLL